MSKFGLLEPNEESEASQGQTISERLASFPAAAPRERINLVEMDAAAAPHGFVSREPLPSSVSPLHVTAHSRRRRLGTMEPTRHLAIRLTVTQYDRFVAYADRHQLTYHDALSRLLDEAGV